MTNTNRGTTKKIEASATGCEVASATVRTWQMGVITPDGTKQRQWAQVNVGKLLAGHFEESDNALEALAIQLETLAAKVRGLKAGA